ICIIVAFLSFSTTLTSCFCSRSLHDALPIFSPKAQRVINGAIVKAQALREAKISTRYLLLSLLDDPETLVQKRQQQVTRGDLRLDLKSTRLNSSHDQISYAVFCL